MSGSGDAGAETPIAVGTGTLGGRGSAHVGVVAVKRRIDVSTVIDRFGAKLRVMSALVVTKKDGARLGIVLVAAFPDRRPDRLARGSRETQRRDERPDDADRRTGRDD